MTVNSGDRIKEARKAAHLTQEQLAQKCGMATITIRQYENGKRQPRLEQLLSISDVLGVSFQYLIDGVDENGDDAIQRAVKNTLDYLVSLESIQESLGRLNADGQREAAKRVRELSYIPDYAYSEPTED